MQIPISYRKGIPFFYGKSKLEIQSDKYERYHELVRRQSALHLVDELWGKYPMQEILDFGQSHCDQDNLQNIVEVGCSVGRWIAHLAATYPQSSCWGLDYSYQMLKQANDFWVLGKEIEMDYSDIGFAPKMNVQGSTLSNLKFGLAKAAMLPFEDSSQDLLVNSFLIDRLPNPLDGLIEMSRVLKRDGKLIVITPLNFSQANHWAQFLPLDSLRKHMKDLDFTIIEWREDMIIEEPIDARGNFLSWKCLAFVAEKN